MSRRLDRLNDAVFSSIYANSLVYNTCWEDPAVDHLALELTGADTLLVITSAGCNVLDYALASPRRIYAVDANPRQTALLELKLAGIRKLSHQDFFLVFGRGRHNRFREIYHDALRPQLVGFSRDYWDRNYRWFDGDPAQRGFYFRGLAGWVARGFHTYLKARPNLKRAVYALLEAPDLPRQREIYDREIRSRLWSRGVNWTLSQQFTLNLLGVPHPQRAEVQRQHQQGVAGFIREAVEQVFREIPLATNYFWSVYLRGEYTPRCCPRYLSPEGFEALRSGLVERIEPHTTTVTRFLQRYERPISRFVLLDHMDWMSSYRPAELVEEWAEILRHAGPQARIIFRSAHAEPTYLRQLHLRSSGAWQPLSELLRFYPEQARALSVGDRVRTYAGFHIADVVA